MRIEQIKNNQIKIFDDLGNIFLQSYKSVVCKIDKAGNITLGKNWDYSITTLKYLYQFILDITGEKLNSKSIKKLIEQGNILIDETL